MGSFDHWSMTRWQAVLITNQRVGDHGGASKSLIKCMSVTNDAKLTFKGDLNHMRETAANVSLRLCVAKMQIHGAYCRDGEEV